MTYAMREPVLHPTPILSLRPTQMTLGMREVEGKTEGLARLRPSEAREISRLAYGAGHPRARRRSPISPITIISRGRCTTMASKASSRPSSPTFISSTKTRSGPCSISTPGPIPMTARGKRRLYSDLPKTDRGHERRSLSLAGRRTAPPRRFRQGFDAVLGIPLGGLSAPADQGQGAREKLQGLARASARIVQDRRRQLSARLVRAAPDLGQEPRSRRRKSPQAAKGGAND